MPDYFSIKKQKESMSDKPLRIPDEFQNQVNKMVLKLVKADLARFLVFSPLQKLSERAYSKAEKEPMEAEYKQGFWRLDPMHPSRYEGDGVTVVSNSMLMPMTEWKATELYQQFLKPHGYIHNVDVFFYQSEKIVGVLTLLRSMEIMPFTETDVSTLKDIQPFMEYTVANVFLPSRIHDRNQLMERYKLTIRELDVLEYALTGLSNKELVRHLDIGLPTLRTHLQNIFQKVGVHSTSKMISKVLREAKLNVDFL